MLKLQYFGHLHKELTHWKRPWCWQRLKIGREGDDRGWDGWMVSLTQWTWVGASSGSWWWTGKPGVLQSMGSQRVWDTTEWLNLLKPFPSHESLPPPSLALISSLVPCLILWGTSQRPTGAWQMMANRNSQKAFLQWILLDFILFYHQLLHTETCGVGRADG